MDQASFNFKINDIVSIPQLKKKLKSYLSDKNYPDLRMDVFPFYYTYTLVLILEELISDCITYVKKDDKIGLYNLKEKYLRMVIDKNDKYNFLLKYMNKYSGLIKYSDSLFFNYKKVLDCLETSLGSKIMISIDTKNLLAYLVLSLQYEYINLALVILDFSNKKTFTKDLIFKINNYVLNSEIASKINLKLDSMNIPKKEKTDDKNNDKIEVVIEDKKDNDDEDDDDDNNDDEENKDILLDE